MKARSLFNLGDKNMVEIDMSAELEKDNGRAPYALGKDKVHKHVYLPTNNSAEWKCTCGQVADY